MGIIIDSCKQHFVCCHTEGIGIMTEPNINSRKISFTENDEDYDNNDQKGQKPGKEIYCSPKPSILEEYTSFSETKNDINGAKYMIGLMMRVKPDKIRNSSDNKEYWVLNSNINEARPYRILIKENLNSSTTNKEDSEDSSDDN